MRKYVLFLSRLFIGAIFIFSAIIKIKEPLGEIGYMKMFHIPATGIFLILAIAVELIAGLFFILNLKPRLTGTVLLIYLVIITLIFHANMNNAAQQIHFLKNLAIMGGILHVTVSKG